MPGTSVSEGLKVPIHDKISELQRKIQLLGKFSNFAKYSEAVDLKPCEYSGGRVLLTFCRFTNILCIALFSRNSM